MLSFALSVFLSVLMMPELQRAISDFNGQITPHIIFNGISLWEPLFVYGWLQLRFERAFGYIVAPVLAGAAFAIYHIGSFPNEGLVHLFVFGLVYGVLFSITKNLLLLVPLTWAIGSSIGTIDGGFSFGWDTVGIYLAVLVVQLLLLRLINSHSKNLRKK